MIERLLPESLDRLRETFWNKVLKTDGCWEWQGYVRADKGYGQLSLYTKDRKVTTAFAQRIAWELTYGSLTSDQYVDHLCRNRKCVRIDHLEPVTNAENIARGHGIAPINASKTHCKWGHVFDDANTVMQHGKYRDCRKCRKIRGAKSNEARRQRLIGAES